MPNLILNLSAWIERRRDAIGPYADHIVHSTKHYEQEIERLRVIAYQPPEKHPGECNCLQCVPF